MGYAVLAITQLAEQLGRQLLKQNACVSTAESCTRGGIAEAITRVAGSSAWFEVGFVTYSNRQKIRVLQVAETDLLRDGAVSQSVVEGMVRGAQQLSGAQYAVAVRLYTGCYNRSPTRPYKSSWLREYLR